MSASRALCNSSHRKQRNISWAKENGFNSIRAMEKAQEPILQLADQVLPKKGGPVLDLGCGNSFLLKALSKHHPAVIPFGIDHNLNALTRAKSLQPKFAHNFFGGDLFNAPNILPGNINFEITIITPLRFLETNNLSAKTKLLQWLQKSSHQVLAYIYKDKSEKYKDWENIFATNGFKIIQKNNNDSVAMVKINI